VGKLSITVQASLYGTGDGFDTLLLLCTLSNRLKRRPSQLDQKQRRADCSMTGAEDGIILLQSFSLGGGEYDAGDEVIRNRNRERNNTKYEAPTSRCNAEVKIAAWAAGQLWASTSESP